MKYFLVAEATVTVYTTVETDSYDGAIRLAKGRTLSQVETTCQNSKALQWVTGEYFHADIKNVVIRRILNTKQEISHR